MCLVDATFFPMKTSNCLYGPIQLSGKDLSSIGASDDLWKPRISEPISPLASYHPSGNLKIECVVFWLDYVHEHLFKDLAFNTLQVF